MRLESAGRLKKRSCWNRSQLNPAFLLPNNLRKSMDKNAVLSGAARRAQVSVLALRLLLQTLQFARRLAFAMIHPVDEKNAVG